MNVAQRFFACGAPQLPIPLIEKRDERGPTHERCATECKNLKEISNLSLGLISTNLKQILRLTLDITRCCDQLLRFLEISFRKSFELEILAF